MAVFAIFPTVVAENHLATLLTTHTDRLHQANGPACLLRRGHLGGRLIIPSQPGRGLSFSIEASHRKQGSWLISEDRTDVRPRNGPGHIDRVDFVSIDVSPSVQRPIINPPAGFLTRTSGILDP